MKNEFVGERFAKALEEKYGKMNNPIIADKYGFAQQTIGQAKKKKAINETIALICGNEDINLNWIQTGKGAMFTADDKKGNFSNHQVGNGNFAVNGNAINISINQDQVELVENFKKLPKAKQDYIFFLVKAEAYKTEAGM